MPAGTGHGREAPAALPGRPRSCRERHPRPAAAGDAAQSPGHPKSRRDHGPSLMCDEHVSPRRPPRDSRPLPAPSPPPRPRSCLSRRPRRRAAKGRRGWGRNPFVSPTAQNGFVRLLPPGNGSCRAGKRRGGTRGGRPHPSRAPTATPVGSVWSLSGLGQRCCRPALTPPPPPRAPLLLFFLLIPGIRLKPIFQAGFPLSLPLSAARERLRRERQPGRARGSCSPRAPEPLLLPQSRSRSCRDLGRGALGAMGGWAAGGLQGADFRVDGHGMGRGGAGGTPCQVCGTCPTLSVGTRGCGVPEGLGWGWGRQRMGILWGGEGASGAGRHPRLGDTLGTPVGKLPGGREGFEGSPCP